MARKTRNQRKKAASSPTSQQVSSPSLMQSALTTYRPLVDGILFVLAIIGVIVTVHLWIQQEIVQFSQGCWGFNPPAGGASASSDCALVAQSDAGKLFGISNVIWGIGFYIMLSVLGFMVARASVGRVALLKRVRAGLIAFGFFFSMYLVNVQLGYVADGLIEETCKLCMTSAVIAGLLFIVMLVDLFTSGKAAAGNQKLEVAPSKLYAALPIVAVLMLAGDYAWFTSKASSEPAEVADAATSVQNASASAEGGEEAAELSCELDSRYDPFPNYQILLADYDPTVGPKDAPVTVIEYFDPNCPHCQALHPVMKNVIEKYKDRVLFVYKPYALGAASLPQIEAMYVAQEQGKFAEMLDAQMALGITNGMAVDQVRSVANEIGMDVTELNSSLRAEEYRATVMNVRQYAATTGLSSVPAVIINGKFVGSRSQACIEQFIEAELQ